MEERLMPVKVQDVNINDVLLSSPVAVKNTRVIAIAKPTQTKALCTVRGEEILLRFSVTTNNPAIKQIQT